MLDFLKNIFNLQEKHNVPIIRKSLVRSEKEIVALSLWKEGKAKSTLQKILQDRFEHFLKEGNVDNQTISFYNSPKSNGFIFYQQSHFHKKDLQHLFDAWKDNILDLGYSLYMSDVKEYARKNHVEKTERHYLKPKKSRDSNLTIADQKFGNISLELRFHDETIQYLKLLCNNYSDKNFTEVESFNKLILSLIYN